MRQVFKFIACLYLIACNHPDSKEYERNVTRHSVTETTLEAKPFGFKVIGIKDGDTFVVLMEDKEQVVRFAHIDCPEKNQPFGTRAKQFVSDLCFGTYVTLIYERKFDKNKRLIAEVILKNGKNLNKELITSGLAWHFKKYSANKEYAQLEKEAKSKKIGIWSEPNPIAPWQWRKLQ